MAASAGPKTRLFAITGTDDFVYPGNQAFKGLAESLELDLTYEEMPGGHDWKSFDPMIPRLLEWLQVARHHE
jgi:S-formylglutathione hydrolase FrmB